MTQGNREFNPFDPTGMFKDMRDANIDAWAKMMVSLVNTEAYSQATGSMLDAWLTTSGPFQKSIQNAMSQALAQLNLPSRDDVTRVAERLTNIEIRLDDMEAQLDELESQLPTSGKEHSSPEDNAKKSTKRRQTK